MIKKLIKHEFKAVSKLLLIMAAFMVVLTGLGVVGAYFIQPPFAASPNVHPSAPVWVGLYFMLYALTAFALTAGTFVYLGIRFYRSMYGNAGYLTNSLPVTPAQLIVAKMLTAICWVSVSIGLLMLSISSLVAAVLSSLGIGLGDFWASFVETNNALHAHGLSYTVLALLTLVSVSAAVLMMYGAAALGQLMKKHRILASVGFYFIMSSLLQFIVSISLFITLEHKYRPHGPLGRPGRLEAISFTEPAVVFIVLTALVAGGLFVLTHYVTKKRLNLE